jgi:homoserine trans-succinylase
MEFFPETAIVNALDSTWHPTATSIYRNWLQYIIARKAETATFAHATTSTSHRNTSPVS